MGFVVTSRLFRSSDALTCFSRAGMVSCVSAEAACRLSVDYLHYPEANSQQSTAEARATQSAKSRRCECHRKLAWWPGNVIGKLELVAYTRRNQPGTGAEGLAVPASLRPLPGDDHRKPHRECDRWLYLRPRAANVACSAA